MTEISEEEMLRDLAARARALPREIEPPADAWSAIRAGIEKPLAPVSLAQAQRFWKGPAILAAAGLLLVAGSSLVTVAVVRDGSKEPVRVATENNVPASEASTFAEFVSVENDYIGTVNQLSAVLESERMTLSPETVAKLRQSLEVIDAAILEARRALAADPANKAIVEMLRTSYDQKLDLLKRTTEMGRS